MGSGGFSFEIWSLPTYTKNLAALHVGVERSILEEPYNGVTVVQSGGEKQTSHGSG
jgi:hypothetical protein